MGKTTKHGGGSAAGLDIPTDRTLVRGARIAVRDGSVGFSGTDGGTVDSYLTRGSTANSLATPGSMAVGGNHTVGGDATITGITTVLGYFGSGGNFGLGSGASLGGFFGATAIAKPEVTGSRADNSAALANLLTALANLGLIVNSTSA